MYTEVSEACKTVVKGNVITTIARLTFEKFFSDSSDLVIEKDISSNGLKIADYCFDPQTGKLIGTATSKELEIEIINTLNYELENKEFKLEVGVLIDRENLVYEYIPYGTFLVMSYEDLKSANKYKIVANDTMVRLNPTVRLNTKFTPTYPITAKEYYREFMASYGIEIEEQELCNGDFLIENPLDFGEHTGRYVLGKLAELFGSFAKINRNNKCQMYLETETDEIIELSQMNSVLEIDKIYGPVNVVTIGLSQVEGENVTLEDAASIQTNGETTIRIDDNDFLYTEELRERAIEQLFERLNGFTYVPVSFKCKALLYSDCGDRINVRDIKTGNIVDTIILNQDIVIPKTRQSKIDSPALTNNQQKYKYISQSKQAQTQTEIMVNKHEKNIKSIVSEIGDRSEKTTTITQDLEATELLAKRKADITNTVEDNGKIVLENTMAGELLELYIYGNNSVFKPLLPSDTLYPSDDLYPMGDSLIKVTRQTVNDDGEIVEEESEIIDLEITEELRQKDDVRDEVFLINNELRITRRIGVYADGTTYIKATPEKKKIKDLKILTVRGNLIIEILNYTAPIKSRYVTINDFTNVFATTVEMTSAISQMANSINLEVNKKVGKEEIIARINMAVLGKEDAELPEDIEKSIIEILANKISIKSDNFELTKEGIIKSIAGVIAGWNILEEKLYKTLLDENGNSLQSGLYIKKGNTSSATPFIFAGFTGKEDEYPSSSKSNLVINHNGYISAKWIALNVEDGTFWLNFNSGRNAFSFDSKSMIWKLDDTGNGKWFEFRRDTSRQYFLLYDAPLVEFFDGVHNKSLMRIIKTDGSTLNANTYFETNVYVSGTRQVDGVNNSIYVQGYEVQTSASDERLKDNIKDCTESALDILNQIPIISFEWRKDTHRKDAGTHKTFGYGAQRTQKVFPDGVIENKENDTYQMDLLGLSGLHTKSIQELTKENKKLKKMVNFLVEKLGFTKEMEEFLNGESDKLVQE